MSRVKRLWLMTVLATLLLFTLSGGVAGAPKLIKGQTVYIPCYSNVISGPPIYMVVPLRANLVIHNTDPSQPITILRIDDYDSDGKKVSSYLKQPVKLNPLAATRVVIKETKKEAEGLGANFIIQWQADKRVNEPIIECLMLGTLGNQGFSFTAQGRIIQEESE
ncbi:MAG: DUF3124 domain-containing protein [Syntrophobacterales bacterium]|nr:DUF3124 domain-containing protein [Syntrophobacterales bacterium]